MRIRLVLFIAGMALTLSGTGSAQAMGGAMIGLGAAMMGGMMHQGTHGSETSDRGSDASGHSSHDRAISKSESEPMSGGAEYEEQRTATITPQPIRPDPSFRTSPAADAHGPR